MKTLAAMVVGVVVVGCGAPVTPDTEASELPAATWSGRRGLVFEGVGPIGDDYQVKTTPGAYHSGTISGLCHQSDSAVEAGLVGDGQFSWAGELACPPVKFGFCDAVAITFTSVAAYPSDDGLAVFAGGEAIGCGETWPVSFSFVGQR